MTYSSEIISEIPPEIEALIEKIPDYWVRELESVIQTEWNASSEFSSLSNVRSAMLSVRVKAFLKDKESKLSLFEDLLEFYERCIRVEYWSSQIQVRINLWYAKSNLDADRLAKIKRMLARRMQRQLNHGKLLPLNKLEQDLRKFDLTDVQYVECMTSESLRHVMAVSFPETKAELLKVVYPMPVSFYSSNF